VIALLRRREVAITAYGIKTSRTLFVRRRGLTRAALLTLLLCGAARTSFAQATSDVVPTGRTEPIDRAIRADLEQNRYHLGPIRLFPFVEIGNAGYNNNIFGTTDHKVADETADLSAGARILVPIGSKLFLRGTAAPTYIWYREHAEGRTFGGTYEAELALLFNHLRLDGYGRDSRSSSLLNLESLRTVLARTQVGHATAEVDVAGPVSLFGEAEKARYRFDANPRPEVFLEDPGVLNRNEERVRAGFRLHRGEELSFSLAAENVRTTFSDPAQGGDNRSRALLLGVRLDRSRFYVDVSAGYRDAEPIRGSRFREFRTATGSYFVSWTPRSSVELFVDGYRGAQYSLTVENPYYLATSNGGGVNLRFGPRVTLRAFGNYDENRYPVPVAAPEFQGRRLDKVVTYGGGFQWLLGRRLTVGVIGTEYHYDSNVPGAAGNVFRVTSVLSFQLSPIVSIKGGLS